MQQAVVALEPIVGSCLQPAYLYCMAGCGTAGGMLEGSRAALECMAGFGGADIELLQTVAISIVFQFHVDPGPWTPMCCKFAQHPISTVVVNVYVD
jgi:hypothetical protein